jgi:hypothetical protein
VRDFLLQENGNVASNLKIALRNPKLSSFEKLYLVRKLTVLFFNHKQKEDINISISLLHIFIKPITSFKFIRYSEH